MPKHVVITGAPKGSGRARKRPLAPGFDGAWIRGRGWEKVRPR